MATNKEIPAESAPADSIFAPLRHGIFPKIWAASLGSNFGSLIQGVGAAWAMTELSGSAEKVALVQTASFTPILLLALVCGAIADMYDRRIVGLVALVISIAGSAGLTACTFLHRLTPEILLGFCFLVGMGGALFSPAWQASVREQVPSAILPQAISLNSISYNIARSFGPAIGGVLVAAAGAGAAFIANSVLYLPMLVVLLLWRREREVPRLPPENLWRAIVSGVRYIINAPPLRIVLFRAFVLGVFGGAAPAMMPLVARNLVHGGALTYGVLLGAFGVGAVVGALSLARIRARVSNEALVAVCIVVLGLSSLGTGLSRSLPLTVAMLMINGSAWMVSVASYNIEVQLAAPRWVSGRVLAVFQAAVAGGMAIGAVLWGRFGQAHGVAETLLLSGAGLLLLPLLALWLRMPNAQGAAEESEAILADPELKLDLTPRSGPIVLEIEYRVDPRRARLFYQTCLDVQKMRQRNGAYGWSISRDIADPERWIERFHCPTWHDYLRQRTRATQAERTLQANQWAFHLEPGAPKLRRMLERPFGSVRWREDTPESPDALPRVPMPGAP